MAIVTIATLWNEHGPQFRIDSRDHPKHVFDAELAKWPGLCAAIELEPGCAPLTITIIEEERKAA